MVFGYLELNGLRSKRSNEAACCFDLSWAFSSSLDSFWIFQLKSGIFFECTGVTVRFNNKTIYMQTIHNENIECDGKFFSVWYSKINVDKKILIGYLESSKRVCPFSLNLKFINGLIETIFIMQNINRKCLRDNPK